MKKISLWVFILCFFSISSCDDGKSDGSKQVVSEAPAAQPLIPQTPPAVKHAASQTPVVQSSVEVYFSPLGGCKEAIIAELRKAKKEVLVQAYFLTHDEIISALADLPKSGVKVEVIWDGKGYKEGPVGRLKGSGVSVLIDSNHPIAHNKIMIIDDNVLITGSFNFTKEAEKRNAENLLIIKDNPNLISKYKQNYYKHREHSKPLELIDEVEKSGKSRRRSTKLKK